MEKTTLTPTQQQELKSKGMIINQDFENTIQAIENQNRLNTLNQKRTERKTREQEQAERIQAIITAEQLQKELEQIPLDEITDNENLIDIFSIIIVFSILNKRIATGDKTARMLKQEFANMLAIRKNLSFSSIPVDSKKYSLSDVIAIYNEAYLYLWDMIVNKNHSYDDKITIQLKTKEKEKTVFQHAFSIAGKYIREQASNDVFNKSITYTTVIDVKPFIKGNENELTQITNSITANNLLTHWLVEYAGLDFTGDTLKKVRGNGTRILKTDKILEKHTHKTIGYVYIEDLSQGDETANDALDREYIKINACGIGSLNEHGDFIGADITAFDSILEGCGLTEGQERIIKLRLKGYNIVTIAKILYPNTNTNMTGAVTTQLSRAQEKIKNYYPQLIRHFNK